MSDLIEVITSNPTVQDELKDDSGPAWHIIRDEARSYVYEQDRSAMSYADAWDIVTRGDADVPDLQEIGISSGSVLDAVVACAIRADEAVALGDMETDLDRLESVYNSLDSEGLRVHRIETDSCTLGFLPHESEKDWDEPETVMYHWADVEGSGPQDVLLVMFGDARLWLYVKPETYEDE